jgi:hypothetical protein
MIRNVAVGWTLNFLIGELLERIIWKRFRFQFSEAGTFSEDYGGNVL